MKKTLLKLAAVALLIAASVLAFSSCDESGLIDEDAFRNALTNALSNVTMDVDANGDMSYHRRVRIVGGKSYVQRSDGDWEENDSAKSFVLVIGAISKHYAAFSFTDGAYRAESLHLVDEEDHYTDVSDVKITFDLSGNAKSISFSEITANGAAYTYSIKLSAHGSTTAPDNVVRGDSSSGGSVDRGEQGEPPSDSYLPEDNISSGSPSDDGFGNSSSGGPVIGGEEPIPGAEVDKEMWIDALNLDELSYSAEIVRSSSQGDKKCYYRIVDGVAYGSDNEKVWEIADISEYTSIIYLFSDRFDEFEFESYRYHCDNPVIEGYNMFDVSAIFDTSGRLCEFSYSIVVNGECSSVTAFLSDYGSTAVPDGLSLK